jgi:hypothetical protein
VTTPTQTLAVPTGAPLGEFASRLQADESGSIKREYCEMFDAAQSEARRRMYEPLTTEEHEAAAALAESTRQCSEVVGRVWSALHP